MPTTLAKSPLAAGAPALEPVQAARLAGLRYVTDAGPGIRRLRAGAGFRYVGPDGRPVRDPDELKRIRLLVIPPAWTDVWICPRADGHLQATGRDARGRKQYRYHERWREVRDETKYDRMRDFGKALPAIRRQVARHLALTGLPREKVLATVVRLMEETHIRVGNEEYARQNGSFGLTTLRNRHVEVTGSTLRFGFRGKSGVRIAVDVNDPRLAKIVRRCRDLPGQELFQYVDDDGELRPIDSADVNDYLREIAGSDFTAKDFRTWAGTVMAFDGLRRCPTCPTKAAVKRAIVKAVAGVAERLANTPAVCRRCYIHPAVLTAYTEGRLEPTAAGPLAAARGLDATEKALMAFLDAAAREAARAVRAVPKRAG